MRWWLRQFIFDVPSVTLIDGRHVGVVDADLAARNRKRIERAKRQMGAKYVCANPIRLGEK